MKQKSRWEKCQIQCPEEDIDTELLLEWQEENGKKVLKSVSCKNTKLMDLKPEDCQWSCWEELEQRKETSNGNTNAAYQRTGTC